MMIYALTEPTGEIRYVGFAVDAGKRYLTHWNEGVKRTHKNAWLRSLRARGMRPGLVTLEALQPGDDWRLRERHWIAVLRAEGCDLTNGTDGGEGGYIAAAQTLEARIKRAASNRGQKRSPEFCAAQSERMTARPVSETTRERIRQVRTGVRIPDATRAKLSAVSLGVSKSQRHAENIGKAKQGEKHPSARLTSTDVIAIRMAAAEGVAQPVLAHRYGVDRTHINKIVHRKVWRHI